MLPCKLVGARKPSGPRPAQQEAQISGEIPTEEMALGAGLRIQPASSNGGRGLKTTKVQAFGGSNPSPSAFAFRP